MMQRADGIFPALSCDIDRIVEIEKKCFSDAWTENMFRSSLEDPESIMLVRILDGCVIGYVVASFVLDEVNIDNIAVLPEYRRAGIARALLNRVEEEIRSFANCIMLEVREGNESAIALYSSLGYERVGLRRNYYHNPTENAILMTKYLLSG
ncbi:MAG: ribosomal protein S18-alanine N-acetyltransferase [Clostridiales bacterium]|jgi:ribosomal-protein-alanine N-acetyltransferase|nr:ribosomal protein S18-alanine N-acetyltransferase [Clostridiales bacterium]